MNQAWDAIGDLDKTQKVQLVKDFFHRIIVHYGLWFTEVRHQLGMQKALALLSAVFERSSAIQLKRLGKVLDFEVENGLPKPLLEMPAEKLEALIDAVSVNWLANDGVWFQGVEFAHGMNDAKRCNDSCWGHFSPFEADTIARVLELGPNAGLEGLEKALKFRVYARINTQSFEKEGDSVVFKMNVCRVQAARQRKGLDDYPCKSGGLVEYARFAETIDPRIQTECVGCPPDTHPPEWFCAWRFWLK
ncbi:MAG: cytosolic protein [Proteobacteria bacterium]|nr:MAG: cytosolic protein [Pseudomonadota bacterium]PIE68165.1 MAG: cytosolic protein [Deltaproteobacteria bacterium]